MNSLSCTSANTTPFAPVNNTFAIGSEIWVFDVVTFRECVPETLKMRRQYEADDADFVAGGWVQHNKFITTGVDQKVTGLYCSLKRDIAGFPRAKVFVGNCTVGTAM